MSKKDEEEVLVIKTDILFPEEVWEGFREFKQQEIFNLINKNKNYLKRKFAEEDENWQQIIPQIALIVGNKIFIHNIPQTGSEGRLHDMWPIFLGGHINNLDGGITEAMLREFKEEIDYRGNIINKIFLGLVKLNSPKVNAVHTGLVWIFMGDSEKFESTEDEGLKDGKFIPLSQLKKYYSKMTYWSKTVAPAIIKKYSKSNKSH
jgi:predicted NUDIX family phosphoesterase